MPGRGARAGERAVGADPEHGDGGGALVRGEEQGAVRGQGELAGPVTADGHGVQQPQDRPVALHGVTGEAVVAPVGEVDVRPVSGDHRLGGVADAGSRTGGLPGPRGEGAGGGVVRADDHGVVQLAGQVGEAPAGMEGQVAGAGAGRQSGPRDLGERPGGRVEPVGVDGVGAQVDGEDVTAVGRGDDLVGVRSALTGSGRRRAVGDQVGALPQ